MTMHKTATQPLPKTLKRKPTAAAPVEQRSITADINALFDKYNIAMPSISRSIVSFIACAVVGGAIGYVGGTLLAFAIAGVMTLTGSVLLAFLIQLVGIVAIVMAAWFAGGWTGGFIMSGNVDRCYQKCSTTVRGWFKRDVGGRNVEVAMTTVRRARGAAHA